MKALTALYKYFNTDGPGRMTLKEFKGEVDQLSGEDKDELGALAAAELGESFEKTE